MQALRVNKNRLLAALLLAALFCLANAQSQTDDAVWVAAQTVTPKGVALASFIDSLHVDTRWQAKEHISWFSGLPNSPGATIEVATHCSAFAASVAERLGVYLLRPPQHSQGLLASDQVGSIGWVGHAAVVRPYAQMSLQTLLARGPRVAQASTVNSPSTDMNLSKNEHYLWAAFRRPAPAPTPAALEWADGDALPTRYLLDAAPGGRWDAFKLFYNKGGAPTWQLSAGGQASAPPPGAAVQLAGDWYELSQLAKPKGEPFSTGKCGRVTLALATNGSALSPAEGGGSSPATFTPVTQRGGAGANATGWYYADVEDVAYGLFITDDSGGKVSGYLLGWDSSSLRSSWQALDASWQPANATAAGAAQARGVLLACWAGADGHEACAPGPAVQLDIAPGGANVTLSGVGGGGSVALEKATDPQISIPL
eukprot:scaffold1.g5527.t1